MSRVSFEQISDLLCRVTGKPDAKFTMEQTFRADLRMDSLQSLDLLVLIEEELGIVVPQDKAVKIQSVQQLFDFLNTNK